MMFKTECDSNFRNTNVTKHNCLAVKLHCSGKIQAEVLFYLKP